MTVLSTLGIGSKHFLLTSQTFSISKLYCKNTDNEPYSLEPGVALNLSATSFCTIITISYGVDSFIILFIIAVVI